MQGIYAERLPGRFIYLFIYFYIYFFSNTQDFSFTLLEKMSTKKKVSV